MLHVGRLLTVIHLQNVPSSFQHVALHMIQTILECPLLVKSYHCCQQLEESNLYIVHQEISNPLSSRLSVLNRKNLDVNLTWQCLADSSEASWIDRLSTLCVIPHV